MIYLVSQKSRPSQKTNVTKTGFVDTGSVMIIKKNVVWRESEEEKGESRCNIKLELIKRMGGTRRGEQSNIGIK